MKIERKSKKIYAIKHTKTMNYSWGRGGTTAPGLRILIDINGRSQVMTRPREVLASTFAPW